MSIVGRTYLDPGDRMAGTFTPPRRCAVLVAGRASTRQNPAGPRTVAVRYEDGSTAVIPFARRLRLDRTNTIFFTTKTAAGRNAAPVDAPHV